MENSIMPSVFLEAKDIRLLARDLPGGPRSGKDAHVILDNVELTVKRGEILGIVGPTGCGKTLLLKSIAGLTDISGGSVTMNGTDMTRKKPRERNLSMVFQDFAIYPHYTNKGNIGFRLFSKKDPAVSPEARVSDIARLLHLDDDKLLARFPKHSSLGERQRVAIGKAIAVLPGMVLFDEPLSNIDANLRNSIRHSLRTLLKDHGIPAVYVSHNQIETAEIADTIAVMNNGRIEQTGTYRELYDNPATLFVSLFIGETTPNSMLPPETVREISNGRLNCYLTVRPEAVSLDNTPDSLALTSTVAAIENHIPEKRRVLFLETSGGLFGLTVPLDHPAVRGTKLTVYIPLARSLFFDPSQPLCPRMKMKGA